MAAYTPRTGAKCGCKRGAQRDNCPNCEGTGYAIDFRAIHARRRADEQANTKEANHDQGGTDQSDI